VRELIGRHAEELERSYEESVPLPPRSTAPVLLRARGVERPPTVQHMSFEVHEGEILALFGHMGSGHVAVADLLFGLERAQAGQVELARGAQLIANPTQAREAGVGFISIDRRDGLALEQSVAKNVTLASLQRLGERVWLRGRSESDLTRRMIERLGIRTATPHKLVGQLSGGNQQKVLFARWLVGRRPEVLVLVEPTRGMDVGAKASVLTIVRELAAEGTAVVVVSSEPETVMGVAHRILVAKRGEIVGELAGTTVTEEMLMEVAS
jgi:ribose transport system ATP-binding protein